ncbi:MAG: HIT domain-containing protein [Candidatus Omnitrophica bacterium]|nr:HIT domain-containing protein [Candidatus Omnitrophota bacterium]
MRRLKKTEQPNIIWAPWRSDYISRALPEPPGCIFCRMIGRKKDAADLLIARRKKCFAVLNLYPYNNGHTLIVPNRHTGDLNELQREERDDCLDLLKEIRDLLQAELKPAGFNIGINLGRVAGAGCPDHLHIHIVPRWPGDMNFMPVLAGTKVISQSLQALHRQLKNAYTSRH